MVSSIIALRSGLDACCLVKNWSISQGRSSTLDRGPDRYTGNPHEIHRRKVRGLTPAH